MVDKLPAKWPNSPLKGQILTQIVISQSQMTKSISNNQHHYEWAKKITKIGLKQAKLCTKCKSKWWKSCASKSKFNVHNASMDAQICACHVKDNAPNCDKVSKEKDSKWKRIKTPKQRHFQTHNKKNLARDRTWKAKSIKDCRIYN